MTPGRFRAFFGIAIVLMLTGVVGGALRLSSQERKALPDLGAIPDFTFIERSGQAVRRADLRGSIWVADFVFTRCRSICPIMTTRMMEIQSALKDDDPVRLVSVTVDPVHDTPEVLSEFALRYGADSNRWLFLTGDQDAIYGWIRSGFHLTADDDAGTSGADEPFVHSPNLVLIDPDLRIRGYYDATDSEAVDRLVTDLATLVRSSKTES